MNEEVQQINLSCLVTGTEALPRRWNSAIQSKGDYFEGRHVPSAKIPVCSVFAGISLDSQGWLSAGQTVKRLSVEL